MNYRGTLSYASPNQHAPHAQLRRYGACHPSLNRGVQVVRMGHLREMHRAGRAAGRDEKVVSVCCRFRRDLRDRGGLMAGRSAMIATAKLASAESAARNAIFATCKSVEWRV